MAFAIIAGVTTAPSAQDYYCDLLDASLRWHNILRNNILSQNSCGLRQPEGNNIHSWPLKNL